MTLSCRPQKIELGATGAASDPDSSNMADMTVEQMAMRANQVTDEVETQEPPRPPCCVQKWTFPTVYSGFIDFIELIIDEFKIGAFRLTAVQSLNPFNCLTGTF